MGEEIRGYKGWTKWESLKPNFTCVYGHNYPSRGEHNAAKHKEQDLTSHHFQAMAPFDIVFQSAPFIRERKKNKVHSELIRCISSMLTEGWWTAMQPLVFSMTQLLVTFSFLVYAFYRTGIRSEYIILSSRYCRRFYISYLMKNISAPVKEDRFMQRW